MIIIIIIACCFIGYFIVLFVAFVIFLIFLIAVSLRNSGSGSGEDSQPLWQVV